MAGSVYLEAKGSRFGSACRKFYGDSPGRHPVCEVFTRHLCHSVPGLLFYFRRQRHVGLCCQWWWPGVYKLSSEFVWSTALLVGRRGGDGGFYDGKISQRLSINQRVLLAVVLFAGTNLSLAFIHVIYWLYLAMFLAGMAWLLIMTSFNTTLQLNLPKWVQARVLSIYMLVFQGACH
jgi:hypothetical protein